MRLSKDQIKKQICLIIKMRWTPDTPSFSDSKLKYVTAAVDGDSENGDHDDHENEGVCVFLCAYKRPETELIQ